MKHTLSTLTVLFILLTSSMSWGKINENGAICEFNNQRFVHPFLFKDNKVRGYIFYNMNDEIQLTYFSDSDRIYHKNSDEIFWFDEIDDNLKDKTVLNRQNLSITSIRIDSVSSEKTIIRSGQCEVFKEKRFHTKLGKLKSKYQIELDKTLKDKKNKI